MLGDSGTTEGISLRWISEEECASGGTNSFTAKVFCDETITGNGEGRIDSTDTSDPCNPIVNVSHGAGCPISLGGIKEEESTDFLRFILIGIIAFVLLCIVCSLVMCLCASSKKKKEVQKEKAKKLGEKGDGIEMKESNTYEAN